jgi:DNA invertase Pin-like site-specific DNA recombinase
MPSTNGHGPTNRAILYARVSTDEQARSGYSLAQQIEALREYAAREGYEVLEEVADPGQSGASLERPGMDRVRDLVAAGGVSVVLAQDRDRFAREPAYHYLLRREFEERGTRIRALNDRGDDTPEGELTDGILDQLAKYERAKFTEKSRRGKLRKAREGKIVATKMPHYGYKHTASRDGYEVDEATMPVVRQIFQMVAFEGHSLHGVKKGLEARGLPTPAGKKYWSVTFIREVIKDDVYRPHAFQEVEALVTPEVAARLESDKSYGIWWFNRKRETDRDALLDSLADVAPDALASLTAEERHHVYRTLRLRVIVHQDNSLELSGTFAERPAMCQPRILRATPSARGAPGPDASSGTLVNLSDAASASA